MSSSSGPPSILNIILLYLSLMGLGAMGGYGAFYHVFSERCSALVSQTETKHAESRHAFQSKYEQALEGQRQCMSDSSAKKELGELQGRLEAQNNLSDRHYQLLKQHEDTLQRLATTQTAQEESLHTAAQLRDDLSQAKETLSHTKLALSELNSKFQTVTRDKGTVEVQLRGELETANELLEQKSEDLLELTEEVKECDQFLPAFREEANGLKNYLRTRNHQQCKMEYGKGPFILKFVLKFPQTMAAEPNSFDVELAPLAEMPHTIFTLLDLVDLQLFDGTALIAADSNKIEGGSPNSAISTQTSVKLHERYAKFGYHRSPFGFNEYSRDFPHEPMTIGFSKGTAGSVAGPGFAINVQDNTATRDGEPCFGKIVQGQDVLMRIVTDAPKAADGYRLAMNVEIDSVRLVRKPPARQQQQQQMQGQQQQQMQGQQQTQQQQQQQTQQQQQQQ